MASSILFFLTSKEKSHHTFKGILTQRDMVPLIYGNIIFYSLKTDRDGQKLLLSLIKLTNINKDLQPSWLENNHLPKGWKSKMTVRYGKGIGCS